MCECNPSIRSPYCGKGFCKPFKEIKSNMVEIKIPVVDCEQCPYHEASKVYTSDSYENVRQIKCKKLDVVVHKDLDWHESSTVPDICPFRR